MSTAQHFAIKALKDRISFLKHIRTSQPWTPEWEQHFDGMIADCLVALEKCTHRVDQWEASFNKQVSKDILGKSTI